MKFFAIFALFLLAGCGEERNPTAADAMLGQQVGSFVFQQVVPATPAATAAEQLPDTILQISPTTLQQISGGKPLVLNVWASWCAPCVKELPSLFKLHQQGEFQVVGLSTDRELKTVHTFLQSHGLEAMPTLWDSLGKTSREQLLATQLPITYIISPAGVVKGIEAGEREWNHPQMVEKITKILAENG